MPLVRVEQIYRRARQEGYGVAGFNAENLDMILAILEAAEQAHAPVIVMLWEADIQSAGLGYLEAIVKHGASQSKIPVAIMLDHGSNLTMCLQSMLNGHSAIMIDASHEGFEGNIERTREVCNIAHLLDVLVEGELGTVRRTFEASGPYAEQTTLTEPDDVPYFVEQTGVDALAVSIGTESGIPEKVPDLDFERLRAIASTTDAYLTIHGGSGTASGDVRELVYNGITAFRFASEMRIAYLNTLEQARHELPPNYPDTRHIFQPARQAAKEKILARMSELGCVGKAW